MDTRERVDWRTATWSTVFWVQAVAAVLFVAMWLLAQGPYQTSNAHGGERAWVLIATAIAVLIALAGSAVLGWTGTPRRRGLALGLAGSAVSVAVTAACVAFVILRWA